MNRNRVMKKAAIVGLSAALAAGQATPSLGLAAEDHPLTKEESVYVNLNAKGGAEQITVSDWLKNVAASAALEDASMLDGISNIKGEETFTKAGSSLVWDAKGQDIYYQGTTRKELPVTMDIAYTLDGKEISPEDLPGKSGAFAMTIAYSNHAKEGDVYVPFAALTGVVLPTDKFQNVEIDNGKLVSDADKVIAVGMAFPGLQESLDLSEDMEKEISIPSSITITADVEDFELGNTFTVITSGLLNDIDAKDMDSVNKLKDSMEELKDASSELVDGTGELADGMEVLQEKTGDFSKGVGDLTDGLTQLQDGAGTLKEGIVAYTDGAKALADGISKLNVAIKDLPGKMEELVSGAANAKSGADALAENTEKLSQGIHSVNGGIDAAHSALEQAQQGIGGMSGAITQSTEAMAQAIAVEKALIESLEGAMAILPEEQQKEAEAQIAAIQESIATQTAILERLASSDAGGQIDQMAQAIDALVETTGEGGQLKGGANGVEQGLAQLLEGQRSLQAGLGQIEEGVSALGGDSSAVGSLAEAVGQLADGAGKLTKNRDSLVKGSSQLASAAGQLSQGGVTLGKGTQSLLEGIDQLAGGSLELKDGMVKFDKEGIGELYRTINNDLDKMLEQLDKVSQAGRGYKSFAGIADQMEGQVKFILETEAIE